MTQTILGKISQINDIKTNIDDYINETRYQKHLISDLNIWNQIYSSLWVVSDTTEAIKDYVNSEYPQETGLKYIYTYGLLQALIIQQDAVRHLSEAFELKYELPDKLDKIRKIRNLTIGHPTKNEYHQRGKTHRTYISRDTLCKDGFQFEKNNGTEDSIFEQVNLLELINIQLEEIHRKYEILIQTLDERDKMHKEKYKNNPLENILKKIIFYYFEKIVCGIHTPSTSVGEFALSNLRIIQKIYSEFKDALIERDEMSEYTEYDLNQYAYALSKIEQYFEKSDAHLSESDAYIYYFYIFENHKKFQKIAKEIDDEYNDTKTSSLSILNDNNHKNHQIVITVVPAVCDVCGSKQGVSVVH